MQQHRYLFRCYHYTELNPVRAGMVDEPDGYRWSCYVANANAGQDSVITPHRLYLEPGQNCTQRCQHYRSMFPAQLDVPQLRDVRRGFQSVTPPGAGHYRREMEKRLGMYHRVSATWQAARKRALPLFHGLPFPDVYGRRCYHVVTQEGVVPVNIFSGLGGDEAVEQRVDSADAEVLQGW